MAGYDVLCIEGADGRPAAISATNPLPVSGASSSGSEVTYSAVTITSLQTNGSNGATYTAFSSIACTKLEVVNNNDYDVEYRRGGTGTAMPIPAKTSRLILGITNANEIGVRRIDQSTTQLTIHAEAFAV